MNNDRAFQKLRFWSRLMKSADAALAQCTRRMSVETISMIQEGFRDETDPYGNKWAPKKRPDGRKILRGRTSRLRLGWHAAQVTPRRFIVKPSVDYAAAHQAPRRAWMPVRRMVPSAKRALPAWWRKRLSKAAIAALSAHFGRRF